MPTTTPRTSPSTAHSARGVTIAALAVLATVAFVARVLGTGERTLSWDEAYHLRLALMPRVDEMLAAILANPPSDPLYALLLRAWAGLTGTMDANLRLPSVLTGAALAPAAAWLGCELTRDRRIALGAGLFVAIAPYAVELGQEATPYGFATLWVTLALAAGWRWRRSARPRDGALALAFAVLAVYSHYVAAPVLGVAAMASLTRWAGPRALGVRPLLTGAAIVVLAWLPWLVPMLGAWLSTPYSRTALAQTASLADLGGALSQYTSGTAALLERVRPLQLAGIAAAALLVGRGWMVGRDPERRGLQVACVVAAGLFLVPWLASALTGRWLFVAHLMLPVLPALSVVALAGALAPVRAPATRAVTLAALVLLFGAQLAGLYVHAAHPPHGDEGVRELALTLERDVAAGEPVFVTPAEHQIVIEHYRRGTLLGLPEDIDLQRLYEPDAPTSEQELQASIARFEASSAGAGRAWLIYGPERDIEGRLLAWLGQRGDLRRVASYEIADLYVVDLR